MTTPLIQSIEIERFRGIREGKIEGLRQINILVGKNNSGKSSILDSISLLSLGQSPKRTDVLGRGRPVGITGSLDINDPNLWYLRDQLRPLHFRAKVNNTEGRLSINKNGDVSADKVSDISLLENFFSFQPRFAVSNETFEAKLLEPLKSDRRDIQLKNTLNILFGLNCENFEWVPGNVVIAVFPNHSVRVRDFGDGAKIAWRLLMLLLSIKDGIIAIDELETCQHPGSLQRLCKALVPLLKLQNIQLFVTTHSRECIQYLLEAAQAEKVDAAVVHCHLQDGLLRTRTIPGSSVLTLDPILEPINTDVRSLDLYD